MWGTKFSTPVPNKRTRNNVSPLKDFLSPFKDKNIVLKKNLNCFRCRRRKEGKVLFWIIKRCNKSHFLGIKTKHLNENANNATSQQRPFFLNWPQTLKQALTKEKRLIWYFWSLLAVHDIMKLVSKMGQDPKVKNFTK